MSNAEFKHDLESLNELFLSEEQVASGQYPNEEIYFLSIEDEELGPIWQQDIQEFLQKSNQLKDSVSLRNLNTEDWTPIFSHPLFQRRKPALVSTHTIDHEETSFQILNNGQIQGPYTLHEITTMVDKKELLLIDEVSIDNGESWGHLYEIEEFDRRTLKTNDSLPSLPQIRDEVIQPKSSSADERTNLIAGLAYIGNLKIGKAKSQQITKDSAEQESESASFEVIEENGKGLLWPALFCLSIVGLIFLYSTWDSGSGKKVASKDKTAKNSTKKIAKKLRPKVLKPVKRFDRPKAKTVKIEKNSNVNRRPTSFKKSKAFRQAAKKKKSLTNNALIPKENDDFYYDDNTDPVELDPIRSTLSKDTIDPEFQAEFDDAQRAQETDEIFDEEAEF